MPIATHQQLVDLLQRNDDDAFRVVLSEAEAQCARQKWHCSGSIVRAVAAIGHGEERRSIAATSLTTAMAAALTTDNPVGVASAAVALGLLGDRSAGEVLGAQFQDLRKSASHEMDQAAGFVAIAGAVLGASTWDLSLLRDEDESEDQEYWAPWSYAFWVLGRDVAGALDYVKTGGSLRARAFALAALHDQPLGGDALRDLEASLRDLPSLRLRHLARIILERGPGFSPPRPEQYLVWHLGLRLGLESAFGADEVDEEAYLLPALPENREDVPSIIKAGGCTAGEYRLACEHLEDAIARRDGAALEAFPWDALDLPRLARIPTRYGTLLHTAIVGLDDDPAALAAVLALVRHWPDVNIPEARGETALHQVHRLASPNGVKVAQALLERGGNPGLRNKHHVRLSKKELAPHGQSATDCARGHAALNARNPHALALSELYQAAEKK